MVSVVVTIAIAITVDITITSDIGAWLLVLAQVVDGAHN